MKRLLLVALLSSPAMIAMDQVVANQTTIQEVLKIVVEEQRRLEVQLEKLEIERAASGRYSAGQSQKADHLKLQLAEKRTQANMLIYKVAK